MKTKLDKNDLVHSLSVVIATHNEAKNLARCLESVNDICDELIIVDGASNDETVKIAKTYRAIIIHTTNKTNFHINKQLGNDRASSDIILQLDADEAVDLELFNFIDGLKHLVHLPDDAWWIKRKNIFMGKWMRKGGQYPDPVIRLFKKGRARLPQKSVHEQMVVDGQVGWADGHLIHYSNPTFRVYMEKFNTYSSFAAGQLFDQKISLSFINSLKYFLLKPCVTFCSLFLRHKGFMDGWVGFVFALMSALQHPVAYIKLWEKYERK